MDTLRLLLADDHPLVREGLRRVLLERPGWEIVAEAGDGAEAVRCALELTPDVTIMDIAMRRLNGIDAARQIIRRVPDAQILMLSMYCDETYVAEALRAGARGYLLKESAAADVVQAVTAVTGGGSFFSPAVAKVMMDNYVRHLEGQDTKDRYDLLSEREREVFQLIAEGLNNKKIAATLNLSPGTVETHRAHIMEKLNVHNASEIVLYAVRRGIIR
jgi:DNA-binding NarL/FixJ family response regulator